MAAVALKRAARNAATAAAGADPDPLGHLRTVADALNKEVADAKQNAEVEVVHKLRTGTRRVEATLETILRARQDRTSADQALRDSAEAWLAQLKKLRRAAGEVRDLDVHREIVADEFLKPQKTSRKRSANAAQKATAGASETAPPASTAGPGEADSRLGAEAPDASPDAGAAEQTQAEQTQAGAVLRDQAESLDGWLAGRRQKRADKLVRKLGKLEGALRSNEEAFLAAFERVAGRRRAAPKDAGLLALEDFLRLVDQMPVLEADNLHDFRKGAKKARYVAEAGGDEPSSAAIAKAIKRVQDSIGDWHDWLVLGEEAEQALDGSGAALHACIAAGVAVRFTRAMRITERMRRRLLGEWLAVRGTAKRRGPRAESAPAPLKRKATGAVV
jgi:CHAD domain-containing protein